MPSLIEKGQFTFKQMLLQFQIAMNRARYGRLDGSKSRDEIISEAQILSNDYMDDRLIRSGLNFKQRKISQSTKHLLKGQKGGSNSKSVDELYPNSNRLNSMAKSEKAATIEAVRIMAEKRHSPNGCLLTMDDLSKVLMYVGEALEVKHPTVYTEILQQLNVRSSLADVNLKRIFLNVAKELFAEGINWPKIVSFFAFAGGLAVDCVLNGSSIHVTRIKTWTVEFIEHDLVDWILHQGGWVGLFDHFTAHHQPKIIQNCAWTISAFVLLFSVLLAALMAYILKLS
eukprot:TCONS_00071749-protein